MIKKKKLTHTTAELDELFTASESHSEEISTLGENLETLEETVTEFIPGTPGTSGQILTIGEDGETIWKDPLSLETVTIQLSVETGSGSVAGVPLSVQVEGENNPRSLVTDATGKAQTQINFGLQYTVTFGTITGYLPLSDLVYRASLNSRIIYGVYKEDATITKEHVVIVLYYTTGESRATTVNIETSAGTTSHPVVNNQCEVDIPLGTAYTIRFTGVDGYATPGNQSYTATFHARYVKTYYIGAVTGLAWIKASDGSVVPFENISLANCTELVGLRISSSLLGLQSASFIVPLEYLIQNNVVDSGGTVLVTKKSLGSLTWGPQTLLEQLKCYTSETACMTSDEFRNFDGENNTSVYLAEAASRGLGNLPAMNACRNVTYTINETPKYGFLGSYAQLKTFANNYADIETTVHGALGVPVITIKIGYWWSSTQCSSTYAVYLNNGGFSYDSKTGGRQVVPLLAY